MSNRQNITQLLAALLICAVPASAGNPQDIGADISEWRESLEIDPRVIEGIMRFDDDGESPRESYARALAGSLRGVAFAAVDRYLQDVANGDYDTSYDVDFPDGGFVSGAEEPNGAEKQFEKGFVRTEFRAFIECDGVSPEQAMRLYTSEDFRLKTSSRAKRVWKEEGLACVETNGSTFVSAMLTCNRTTEIIEADFASQHAQVVSNGGGEDYQIVYFKESIKTFVQVPGGLMLHYINYSRSKKVPAFAKPFAGGGIKDAQEGTVEALQHALAKGGS
jgi:hypothetical protein